MSLEEQKPKGKLLVVLPKLEGDPRYSEHQALVNGGTSSLFCLTQGGEGSGAAIQAKL